MAKKGSPQNKSNQIYCTVRDDIVSGKYPGGTFLIEADLCEQFNVSRTPVREALIRLSQNHFLELLPNRGAFIPHVTLSDITDMCAIRAANEGLAAYLLAKNCPPAILKKLEESVVREEMLLAQPNPDPREVSKEDFMFHFYITKYCGNRRLTEILDLLHNQMKRLVAVSADDYAAENSLRRSVVFHRKTLEAIRCGDADAARDRLAEHWWDNLEGYIQRAMDGRLSTQL